MTENEIADRIAVIALTTGLSIRQMACVAAVNNRDVHHQPDGYQIARARMAALSEDDLAEWLVRARNKYPEIFPTLQ